ncbi:MAG: hypothetical protein J0H12_05310 [Candidatus Paracaedimonas acanthamoebae]|uniref:Neurotransmitter-gated ion-channel ligand-binding domain-containing protein n=1 Tax=Candidatus Paracaedimonas acanthamoebae TaxID=244581 RepID=A0A8J7TTF1_9PROT|nr:hypothetical protein [Candidatus Paracaedimonas acanthamoebae]
MLSFLKKLSVFWGLGQALILGACTAEEPPQAPETLYVEPAKEKVLMGVYPVMLHDFDLAHNTFKVSFYAWWRSKDKAYVPDKTVEITNALDFHSKFGTTGKFKDEYFTYIRYYATVSKEWDMRHFPFDHQQLVVALEDYADIQKIIFTPDNDQSALHSEIKLKGWKILGFHLKDSITTYDTNFGDPSTKKGQYSRLSFIIDIKREGIRLFFNYFIGFLVAFFLCTVIYILDPREIGARTSLSLGATFTAIGNKYILDQVLPFTTSFTLADAIQAATFGMIIAAVSMIIYTNHLMKSHPYKSVALLSQRMGLCALLVYTLFVCYYLSEAAIS